jgi:hypothetical protein
MDSLFNEIIDKLNEKKETHPNLTFLWKKQIEFKKKKLLESLNNCNKVLTLLNNACDLTTTNILTLYILLNTNDRQSA